jgi:hypothetical protein
MDSLRVASRLSQIQIFESLARVSDSKIESLARVSDIKPQTLRGSCQSLADSRQGRAWVSSGSSGLASNPPLEYPKGNPIGS